MVAATVAAVAEVEVAAQAVDVVRAATIARAVEVVAVDWPSPTLTVGEVVEAIDYRRRWVS